MADGNKTLSILLQLKADTASATAQVTNSLKQIQAQAAETGAAVAAVQGGGTVPVNSANLAYIRESEAAIREATQARVVSSEEEAIAQARINLQTERRVILETEIEAAEARIAGNPALAIKLEREADIRARAVGIQRTLNITTEESIVLAERMVLAQEASAAAAGLTGVNLAKAKTEALVLGRELAAGNVRASTLSSLLGSLGTVFTIAGIAVFELYQGFRNAVEAAKETAKEAQKIANEAQNASSNIAGFVNTARTFGDEVKMADKVQIELNRMALEMATFRAKELTNWQKFWDYIIKNVGTGFPANYQNLKAGVITPTGGGGNPPTYEAKLNEDKARAQEDYDRSVQNMSIHLLAGSKSVDVFTKALSEPAKYLPEYQKKLADAEAEFASARARLAADPSSQALQDNFIKASHAVETTKGDVEKLTAEQKKLNNKTGEHRDTQRQITELVREQANLLSEIHGQQQIVQQNPFTTDEQKNAQLVPLVTRQIAALNAQIERDKSVLKNSALDSAQYVQLEGKIKSAGREVTLLGQKLQTLTISGTVRASLVQWANEFSNTGRQIANIITGTINTAINATSQAITNAIFKTGSWKQAFYQAAQSIVQNIIQIVLQWAISKTIMAVMGAAFRTAEESSIAAAGSAAASAWAPAATAASIATEGEADEAGVTALAIAMAAGIAIVTGGGAGGAGGFATGGFTGGREGQPAGLVHGQEYVFSAPATRRIGASVLDSLHTNAVRQSYASGGFVGNSMPNASGASGGPSQPRISIYNFLDERKLRKAIMEDRAGHKIIVDVINGRRVELGI